VDEQKYFRISDEIISLTDLSIGYKLPVGRGSGIGSAIISRRPIYKEALKYENLPEYS
jgi:hypothetical protein